MRPLNGNGNGVRLLFPIVSVVYLHVRAPMCAFGCVWRAWPCLVATLLTLKINGSQKTTAGDSRKDDKRAETNSNNNKLNTQAACQRYVSVDVCVYAAQHSSTCHKGTQVLAHTHAHILHVEHTSIQHCTHTWALLLTPTHTHTQFLCIHKNSKNSAQAEEAALE